MNNIDFSYDNLVEFDFHVTGYGDYLNKSFIWSESPEGYEFWSGIYCKWIKYLSSHAISLFIIFLKSHNCYEHFKNNVKRLCGNDYDYKEHYFIPWCNHAVNRVINSFVWENTE